MSLAHSPSCPPILPCFALHTHPPQLLPSPPPARPSSQSSSLEGKTSLFFFIPLLHSFSLPNSYPIQPTTFILPLLSFYPPSSLHISSSSGLPSSPIISSTKPAQLLLPPSPFLPPASSVSRRQALTAHCFLTARAFVIPFCCSPRLRHRNGRLRCSASGQQRYALFTRHISQKTTPELCFISFSSRCIVYLIFLIFSCLVSVFYVPFSCLFVACPSPLHCLRFSPGTHRRKTKLQWIPRTAIG